MREVEFKNKDANHTALVKGKLITFQNGVATVEDEEAEVLLKDKDYKEKKAKAKRKAKAKK